MLSQNPQSNLFVTRFPRKFFVPTILEKYDKYIGYLNGTLKNATDLVNESVMRVDIPGFRQERIEQQTGFKGEGSFLAPGTNQFRAYTSVEDIIEGREVNITLRYTDMYLNYMILLEHYMYYYKKYGTDYRIEITVTLLGFKKIAVYDIIFKNCIFAAIPGISLGYDMIDRGFKEFQVTFGFDGFELNLHVPKDKADSYNNETNISS